MTAPKPAPGHSEAFALGADAKARPRHLDRLARTVLKIFYRRVEVVGAERVPLDRPVVYVGNHVSALIDPALFMGFMPVAPRFLAKSTLWQMAALRPFLRLAAAIPVYRRQDQGVDTSKNAETFARCHEALAAGGAIAIFPEGTSHNEPALVELKTGVSRIVLQAIERFGDIGVRIVPVGLTYDDKQRFRSRVLVAVGEPIDPGVEARLHASKPRAAVEQLTDRVRDGLETVTLNYPSWDEARRIERAVEIYSRPEIDAPREQPLSRSFSLRREFIEGYEQVVARCPEQLQQLAEDVDEYDQQLVAHGLTDAQVASRYPPSLVVRFVIESLTALLLHLPLGAVGIVLNAVPYQAARRISRRFSRTPDTDSTYKIFPSLILYPLIWITLATVAAFLGGPWWFLGLLVLGPLSGYFAIRYLQRQRVLGHQSRAFLKLRSRRRGIDELRQLRRRVLDGVRQLVDVYNQPAAEDTC